MVDTCLSDVPVIPSFLRIAEQVCQGCEHLVRATLEVSTQHLQKLPSSLTFSRGYPNPASDSLGGAPAAKRTVRKSGDTLCSFKIPPIPALLICSGSYESSCGMELSQLARVKMKSRGGSHYAQGWFRGRPVCPERRNILEDILREHISWLCFMLDKMRSELGSAYQQLRGLLRSFYPHRIV